MNFRNLFVKSIDSFCLLCIPIAESYLIFCQDLIKFKSITLEPDVAIMLKKGFVFLKLFIILVLN